MIRWIYLIKYPEGVPVEEGERWYLQTHTQEAKRMADFGLVSYKTWKALESPVGTASRSAEWLSQYKRVTELVFEDWAGFQAAVNDSGLVYSPPDYGPKGFEYQTVFLTEEPEYDLLNEIPGAPG
jgi:hypothetical protein